MRSGDPLDANAAAVLAAILDASDDAIICGDRDGLISTWSAGAERLCGFTAAEATGRQVASVVAGAEHAQALASTDDRRPFSAELVDRNGNRIPALVTVATLRDEQGAAAGTVTIARGDSEEAAARLETRKLRAQIHALVSHDLRTPLATVKGFTELVYDGKAGPVTDQTRSFMERVVRSVCRIERMLDDNLFALSLEAGGYAFADNEVDLGSVIDEAIKSLESRSNAALVSVQWSQERPLPVRGDRDRLVQMVVHLISNAIDFSGRDGVVQVRAEPRDLKIVIEVEDAGAGIADADRERIFKPFVRVSDDQGGTKTGLGLGLTIVKTIAESHGGSVTVESEPGRGSLFTVSLPAALTEAADSTASVAASDRAEASAQTVLIADDDSEITDLLSFVFEEAGFDVVCAARGDDALEIAVTGEPDLVLLDVQMPGMDGFEVLRRFKKTEGGATIPVIFVSTYGAKRDIDRALRSGACDYVFKPFDASELVEKARAALNAE